MTPEQEKRYQAIDLEWNKMTIPHNIAGIGDVVGDLLNIVDDLQAKRGTLLAKAANALDLVCSERDSLQAQVEDLKLELDCIHKENDEWRKWSAENEDTYEALIEVLALAAIPLEALRTSELDGTVLSPGIKQAIVLATDSIRAVLFAKKEDD